MARKVFDSGYADEDEIEDIRGLLIQNRISFFETPRGSFGFSLAAIWVENDSEYSAARKLVDDYQAKRFGSIQRQGHRVAKVGMSTRKPLRWIVLILAVIALFVVWASGAMRGVF